MSTPRPTPRDSVDGSSSAAATTTTTPLQADAVPPTSYAPPTYAAFSPASLSSAAAAATASAAKRRSTILVHQKSPLLLATPPQITRALAYSHPFLLPLNKLAGLLSWTTGDPWESFLLLVAFWAVVRYGDVALRFAAPIVTVAVLIAGMYGRRFSPLSSSGWTEHPDGSGGGGGGSGGTGGSGNSGAGTGNSGSGSGHQRAASSESTNTRHQKTLDEIVDTLKVFTTRCNILMEPLLEMTDFLSTQRTATSATTRPALTTLFVRILAITPLWIVLTLPPLRIITTKRVILVFGTLLLTWHSKACRISRTLLWRSAAIRRIARGVTGLPFEIPASSSKTKFAAAGVVNGRPTATRAGADASTLSNNKSDKQQQGREDQKDGKGNPINGKPKRPSSALTAALARQRHRPGLLRGMQSAGVRFTFILYENQRRWVGLGWTNNLLAYERAAWTDEQGNPMPARDDFELPEVEDAPARWRWVEGSRWRVDGAPLNLGEGGGDVSVGVDVDAVYDTDAARNGWIYYDNKWQNGRRGQDGWNRWTRRRKWYRDAELVEVSADDEDGDEEAQDQDQDGDQTPVASPDPPALPPRTPGAAAAAAAATGSQWPSTSSNKNNNNLDSSSSSPESSTKSSMMTAASTTKEGDGDGAEEEADAAPPPLATPPLMSTSANKSMASRFKWPAPSLRRRTTGAAQEDEQRKQQQQQRRRSG
ncbi:hypothetical protein SLS62_001576 [Diatrype stigma]|uniref:Peroxin/Ferlin domain-containing protein n=1 Tax=Diatrype stigma TaxID=117547 RepID=A0AAN9YWE9_9PEZI